MRAWLPSIVMIAISSLSSKKEQVKTTIFPLLLLERLSSSLKKFSATRAYTGQRLPAPQGTIEILFGPVALSLLSADFLLKEQSRVPAFFVQSDRICDEMDNISRVSPDNCFPLPRGLLPPWPSLSLTVLQPLPIELLLLGFKSGFQHWDFHYILDRVLPR